jgi:hypothetical protein
MKKLIIFSLLGALSLSSIAQTSDVNTGTATVTVTPKKDVFLAQHRYAMQSDEFYKFKRAYELSNGSTVSLYNRGSLMYAKLDGGIPERIVATSGNTFFSTKSDLKLKINLLDNGDAIGEAYIPTKIARN